MTNPSRFFVPIEPNGRAGPCPDPCHTAPYHLSTCHDCPDTHPIPCSAPCHGWPYDPAYCSTCSDSHTRGYQPLDTVEIRNTHPVRPIHAATATVVATTPFSALVQFHNPAHGLLYGSLGHFLEVDNLHLQRLPIPQWATPIIDCLSQEEMT